MAINKKLIHFNTFENFNSRKLSANVENTQYTLGTEGTIQTNTWTKRNSDIQAVSFFIMDS